MLLCHSQESVSATQATLEMEEKVDLGIGALVTIVRKFRVDLDLSTFDSEVLSNMDIQNRFRIQCSNNFPTKVPIRVVAKSDKDNFYATVYFQYPPIKTWTRCEDGGSGSSTIPLESGSVQVLLPLVDGATKTTTFAGVVTTTFTLRLDSCENGSRFNYILADPHDLVELDNSLTSDQIANVKPIKEDSAYRWGRTIGRGPNVTIETVEKDGAWWIESIHIQLTPIEIYLNRRLKPRSCAYTETLNHEFQHASAIRRYWERSAKSAKQRICQQGVPTIQSRSTDFTQQELIKSRIAKNIRSSFSSKVNNAPHEVLDTAENYLRVLQKCSDWP
jgi:hypothetical protein